MDASYLNPYTTVAQADVVARTIFFQKTYLHVAGAIIAFIAIEAALLQMPFAVNLAASMTSGMSWLIVLGAFMGVSWLADKWANSDTSRGMQYAGLGLFVFAEAIIFLPMILIATKFAGQNVIAEAGVVTLLLVAGITAIAFTTKKDFSFLGSFLKIAFFVALGVIVASILFGFSLGIVFSAIMALIAAGSILYTTSNIIHRYNTSQHVAASLALFSGIALLFWYVLQIFMSRD
ncbi:MAG: Bax inhibitor-1 family protein [Verrucomicrobia bacterium]|nr:Bax inhibitor-1 family protein [Verrucomicrobiota bacterium]